MTENPLSGPDFISPPPPPPPSTEPPLVITVGPPESEPKRPVWGLLDVLIATLGFMIAGGVTGAIGVAIARQTPGLRHAKMEDILNNVRVAAPVQIAAYVVLLAIMALLIMMKNRGPFLKEISWNAPERKRVWGAVFVGLALVAFGAVAETLLARWVPKTLPIENYFRDTTSAYLLAFFAVMVAPPVEELYFRGFLYPAVARWTGIWPAVVITSGLFALLHGSQLAFAWVPVMVIFVVGAALNIVRVRTGSVATGVVAHMTYNFVLMLGTFIGTHGFTKFDKM